MRILTAAAVVLTLAGCQQMGKMPVMQRPQTNIIHQVQPKVSAPVIIPTAPVVTPNQQVKHRWYDRFKKHPRFFHQ